MITVGMNYHLIPGKEEIFENAFLKVLEAMQGIEGHQETHLFRDVQNASAYLVVSEWDSRDAFNNFIRSDQFAKVTNWGKTQVLASQPKHEIYEK